MFFSKHPFIAYNHGGKVVMTPNITRRTTIVEEYKDNEALFIDYRIQDNETPEMIADRLYDNPNYSFVILMVNEIHNVYDNWPVNYNELVENTRDKYGNENAVHHYESTDGVVVDADHPAYDRVTVTNLDYEERLNDEKRKIKLLHPNLVQSFVRQHKKLMGV